MSKYSSNTNTKPTSSVQRKPSKRGPGDQPESSLDVTVFPIVDDEEPYNMRVSASANENNLKEVLAQTKKGEAVLNRLFNNYAKGSGVGFPTDMKKLMQQLSIYRKKVDKKHDKRDLTLHILFIKCEGQKLPRNNGAYELEAYCGTHFYGPIIAAYNKTQHPHPLLSFTTEDLHDGIGKINENENKGSSIPQVN